MLSTVHAVQFLYIRINAATKKLFKEFSTKLYLRGVGREF